MSSTIQVRVDDELKEESDALFRELGTDTTNAIRIFLKQAVINHGFPFRIELNSASASEDRHSPKSEEWFYNKLEKAREAETRGEVRDADEFINEIRARYGL